MFMKRMLFAVTAGLLALSLDIAAPVWASESQDAAVAYARGDYATAMRLWRPHAEQGEAFAQFAVGEMYEYGLGVPQDYAEAMRWYRKAAEQGERLAECNLGLMYYLGRGTPRDYTEAMNWLGRAATHGDPLAQGYLGSMYASGEGVPRDYTEAMNWLGRAATQGDPRAQGYLGSMYENGEGVPQDYVQAAKWFNLAAANFFSAAKFDDSKRALADRDRVASKMSAGQIKEAKKLAREWKPTREPKPKTEGGEN
jgi:TPR repeat protein